jgi:MYXO-CTERM domain-containing protein
MQMRLMAIVVGGMAATGTAANAEFVMGTITADNHYALYTSTGGLFSYHGGNETGAGGAPGQYNWSQAESYQFLAGDYLYVAAWSDDAVAQGVLAEFHSDTLGTLLSGDSRWEVYGTGLDRGDGDAHPDALEIGNHVAFADANLLWEEIFAGATNGVQPWGHIAGVTDDAQWMWKSVFGDDDPTQGGSGAGEMLIFRTQTSVPAPASLALLALGGILGRRRRS